MKKTLIAACSLLAAFPLFGLTAQVVDHGIAVDFTPAKARAGEVVTFSFKLADTATRSPLAATRPAAWLALRRGGRKAKECTQQAATYLAGDLFARADVDLNNYYVVALNDDATLTVVDPLFGFGGSKLLAQVDLPGPGEDWVLTPDQSTLYVSIPSANKVAVIDTRKWDVVKLLTTGPNPRRVVYSNGLYVGDDEGITTEKKRFRIGKVYDLAVGEGVVYAATANGSAAFQAAGPAASGRRARQDAAQPAGKDAGAPRSIAYSSAAKTTYALYSDHVETRDAVIPIKPGATQIRFAPNGRYALIANPQANLVQVLDAATNRIVQNGEISDGPDQITFTDLLAYVRRRHSESVLTITLDQLGHEGQPLSVADFPGGQHAYGDGAQSIADSIVPSPEGPAVLVANPADKMIYLYKEGMAAPAGGFSNYGKQPRAALVVDRGLRERKPGEYATTVPVAQPGTYDVVFFLDAPRVVACFAMTVESTDTTPPRPPTRVAAIAPPKSLTPGEAARLRFALVDPSGREKRRAGDVQALAFEAPGIWQQRGDAKALADGTYEFEFTPPSSGTYYLFVESESLGLARSSGQFLIYEAK